MKPHDIADIVPLKKKTNSQTMESLCNYLTMNGQNKGRKMNCTNLKITYNDGVLSNQPDNHDSVFSKAEQHTM